MAWTYFTTDLAPGEIITRDQRNELYDALDERIQAAGNVGDGLHADMDDVRDSACFTWRTKYTWLGAVVTQTPHSVLGTLASRYGRTASAPQPFNVGGLTLFEDIGAILGLTYLEVNTILLSPLESAHFWNIIRTALQLFKYPLRIASVPDSGGREVKSRTGTVYATVAANFVAASFASTTSLVPTWKITTNKSGSTYSITGTRKSNGRLTVPDIPLYTAGYNAWTFMLPAGTVTWSDELTVALDTGSDTCTQATGVTEKLDLGALTSVGDLVFDLVLKSWTDLTAALTYEPPPSTSNQPQCAPLYGGSPFPFYCYLEPVFTHP